MYGPRSKTTSVTPALTARSATNLPIAVAASVSAPVFKEVDRNVGLVSGQKMKRLQASAANLLQFHE